MNIKLKEISIINTGIYDKPTISGNVIYLQAGMFEQDGNLREGTGPNIFMDDLNNKHILLQGDVLLNAKGTKNFAVPYDPQIGPAVASSTFMVIRPKSKLSARILPQYLCWYLNLPKTQAYLRCEAQGSYIPSISKGTLQDLTIPLPDLGTQERILRVQGLREKEKKLALQLEALRDQLIQYTLLTKAQQ